MTKELIDIIQSNALTEERKVEQVQAILGKNSELVNAKNEYGETPLYIASEVGLLEVPKEILRIAVQVGKTEVAQRIIEHMLIRNETKPDFLSGELLNHWIKRSEEIEEMQRCKVDDGQQSAKDDDTISSRFSGIRLEEHGKSVTQQNKI